MNLQLMQDIIHELIDTHTKDEYDVADFETTTFEDANLLTNDKGVLIDFKDGRTFAITITQHK